MGRQHSPKAGLKYAEPLIFESSSTHKQSIILLHGRGSTVTKFAEPLLSSILPIISTENEPVTFQQCFPHAKFVFPTAPLCRAVVYNRSLTHQWFDKWTLDRPEYREDLQLKGLKETSSFVHTLLQQEIELVGAENVAVISLSQGWAASLVALLTWQGSPIAAAVGMCSWLPFGQRIKDLIEEADPVQGGDDLFETVEDDAMGERSVGDKLGDTINWLRSELDVPATEPAGDDAPLRRFPVLMCHGKDDKKVPYQVGQQAFDFLCELGVDCHWKEYPELGHWYSGKMLHDVVLFLQSLKGWNGSHESL